MSKVDVVFFIFMSVTFRFLRKIALIILSIIRWGANNPLPSIKEEFLQYSAKSLAESIRSGKITSRAAVAACIRRIEDINGTINCLVENRFEEALKEADAVDAFIASGSKNEGDIQRDTPFLGVPFTTKDGIAVKDVKQIAGSKTRIGIKANEDAEAVALLREAGGIPLGTTNVPEMLAWGETSNHVYGRTNNPYHTQYTAGGSSGGEAAILATAGSMMGIGSDIAGSIRIPSAACGIFGHKPTACTVPMKGHYPPVTTKNILELAAVGPMSKCASDLLPLMKILTKNVDLRLHEEVDIKKLRYFYMKNCGSYCSLCPVDSETPEVTLTTKLVLDYFKNVHGITVQEVAFSGLSEVYEMWWAKVLGEDGPQRRQSMAGGVSKVNLYKEALKALMKRSEFTMELIFEGAMEEWAAMKSESDRKSSLQKGEKLANDIQELLGDDGVMFYPTQPIGPFTHTTSMFTPCSYVYTSVFNLTQMPVTQCPIRLTKEGLPIGIQVAAAKYNDRLTIAVAEELERGFGGWKPPLSQ